MALLATLLSRAALGIGDDVLLLQQTPDGSWSRPLEPPSQDFEAFATSGDGEQPDAARQLVAQPTAVVEQEGALSRKKHLDAVVREQDAALAASGSNLTRQLASRPDVLPMTAKEASRYRGPVLEQVGEGKCLDNAGNEPTAMKFIPGMTYRQCADECSNDSVCQSADFLFAKVNVRVLSECRLFPLLVTKFRATADTYCLYKTAPQTPAQQPQQPQDPTPTGGPPGPPGPPATAQGDPHLQNMRGKKFDVRRPGNHTFLVVPRGAGPDDAQLYVWADVTPLDGKLCKYQTGLFITELTLTGKWLKPMGGSLRLSTGTKEFNTPATWGLSLGGSPNLSVQDFKRRLRQLPERMGSLRPTNVEKPNTNKNNHVDTMRLQLYLGRSHLTVGWAHTQDPMSNWLWLNVGGIGAGNLGGLLGDDDHTWVTVPEKCEKP